MAEFVVGRAGELALLHGSEVPSAPDTGGSSKANLKRFLFLWLALARSNSVKGKDRRAFLTSVRLLRIRSPN